MTRRKTLKAEIGKNEHRTRWTLREWRKVLKEYPVYTAKHPGKTMYEAIIAVNKLVLPKDRQRTKITSLPVGAAQMLEKQVKSFKKKANSSHGKTANRKAGDPRKIKEETSITAEEKGFKSIHQPIDDKADKEDEEEVHASALSEAEAQNITPADIYAFNSERYKRQYKPAVIVTNSQWNEMFLYATDASNQRITLRKFLEKYLAYDSPAEVIVKDAPSIATMSFDDLFIQITERNDAAALLIELRKYFSNSATEDVEKTTVPRRGTSEYASYLFEKMQANQKEIKELLDSTEKFKIPVQQ